MGLPAQPGTYALVLASDRQSAIRIGSLSTLQTEPGFYVYVGSAFGPGGLAARVSRHQRQAKRLRWHIDYLRAVLALEEVWYTPDGKRRECLWAEAMTQAPRRFLPMAGFGASDCRCASHLFYFEGQPAVSLLRRFIKDLAPDHGPIRRVIADRIAWP